MTYLTVRLFGANIQKQGLNTYICLEDFLTKAPVLLGNHRNEEILNLVTTYNTRTSLKRKRDRKLMFILNDVIK